MPNETDKNKEGASGEGAGAGGAGQGGAGAGNGAGDGAGQGAGGEGETVIMKKSEFEKIQSDLKKSNEDRDNYKEGLLRKKADERNLGGEGQGGGQGGGGGVIDEKKVSEVATAATNKVLRDASEKGAKRSFLKDHPEYLDDVQWTTLMSHLTFKGGEVTEAEVRDRMDAAILEHKRSTGKLDEYLKAEHERGVREGRIQGNLENAGGGTGGAGDKNDGGKSSALTPKGEEMARGMHVDPTKAAKVDPSKDNVINVV